MIDVALRTLILQHAGAAVGQNVMPGTEVGDVAASLPKIAFTQVSAPRTYNDHGPDAITSARFQLDTFAAKLAGTNGARVIADAVRTGLQGYAGTVGDVRILLVDFENESFTRTNPAAGANTAAARFTQDVVVTYRG